MGLSYQKNYQVPFYKSDINHNIELLQLLSLVLQASGKQSLSPGMSDDYTYQMYNLVWIITEYATEIERLPKYTENIAIETVPMAYNKPFCYRDFNVYGESGDKTMTIHLIFVLTDYDSRKVHPVIDEIVDVYNVEKIKKIFRGSRYESLENPEETTYRVRFFDPDLNGRVNNSKYLEWTYGVLDMVFLKEHIPHHINLKYVREVHYRYDIKSRVETDGLITKREIVTQDVAYAQARIEWKEK